MKHDYPLTISNDGKTLIKCEEEYSEEVIIPYDVIEIGMIAISGSKNISIVMIPSSETFINSFSFSFASTSPR